MLRSRFFSIFLFILTAMAASVLLFAEPFRGYRSEIQSLKTPDGASIPAVLFLPREVSGRHPAIISVHYGLQNRETLEPAARAFAEGGVIFLELLLGNEGRKKSTYQDYLSDVEVGVKFLLSREDVRKDRVFLSGHSIGANVTALVAASNPSVSGEIAIGYPVEFPPSCPKAFLMASGVLDELHPIPKMLDAFQATTRTGDDTDIHTGSLALPAAGASAGRIRLFFASFLSDHYTESLDPAIVSAALWFVGGTGPSPWHRSIPVQIGVRLLLFLSLFLFFSAALIELSWATRQSNLPKWLRERTSGMTCLLIFLAVGSFTRPSIHIIPIYVLSTLLLALLSVNLFLTAGNGRFWKDKEDVDGLIRRFFKEASRVSIYLGAFYLSYLAGLILHAGVFPWSRFEYVLRLLQGLLFLIPAQAFTYCTRINGLFLRADNGLNAASPLLWAILATELIFPGTVGRIFQEFFSRVIASLRNLDFKVRFQVHFPELLLFLILLATGFLFWRRILGEGYAFSIQDFLGMAWLLFCFILVPLAIFTFIIRRIAERKQQ